MRIRTDREDTSRGQERLVLLLLPAITSTTTNNHYYYLGLIPQQQQHPSLFPLPFHILTKLSPNNSFSPLPHLLMAAYTFPSSTTFLYLTLSSWTRGFGEKSRPDLREA